MQSEILNKLQTKFQEIGGMIEKSMENSLLSCLDQNLNDPVKFATCSMKATDDTEVVAKNLAIMNLYVSKRLEMAQDQNIDINTISQELSDKLENPLNDLQRRLN